MFEVFDSRSQRQKGPKSLFKDGIERSIVCDCTHEEKINFESFTQNGCYGTLLRFYFIVYSTDAKRSCTVTKQDLTFTQAYRVSFCFPGETCMLIWIN